MAALELDYSVNPEAIPEQKSGWRPPRHVFFGKKDADGVMEEEPVYSHKEYPTYLYKMSGDRIVAKIAKNEAEALAFFDDGYKKTPAAFGYIGAPSFDEAQKMRAAAEGDGDPEPAPAPEAPPAPVEEPVPAPVSAKVALGLPKK